MTFRKRKTIVTAITFTALTTFAACSGGGTSNVEASNSHTTATSQVDSNKTPTIAIEKTTESHPAFVMTKEIRREVTDQIDEASLKTLVEHLSGVEPAPLSSGPALISERGSDQGRVLARQYVREYFESLGLETSEHEFTSVKGYKGKNVEGILRGHQDGRHLYVTGHLDSLNNAGANDDASGIAAIMLAAKALSQTQPRDTIHFVAFDLEELGLIGSYYYVQDKVMPIYNSDPKKITGNIQADMIGHNSGDRIAIFADCNEAPEIFNALMESTDELNLGLAPERKCAGRSDHERFTDKGIPAVFLIDDQFYGKYPWYHEAEDTIEKLDFSYLSEMTRAITGATAKLSYPSQ